MTQSDASLEEFPRCALEIETDYPIGYPGDSVVIRVSSKDKRADIPHEITIGLCQETGETVATAIPRSGAATLAIPAECELGDYSIRACAPGWELDSTPFEISPRAITEFTRGILRASLLHSQAIAAAQDPAVAPELAILIGGEVERLYIECSEIQFARRTWDEMSHIYQGRGLDGPAQEAASRARLLGHRLRAVIAQETPKGGATAEFAKDLYVRYAPRLRAFIQRKLRPKHQVEDVLHEVYVRLLRYPPAKPLLGADNYLWRIAMRLVNATNRRAQRESKLATEDNCEAWLLNLSARNLSPTDFGQWLHYKQQVSRTLGDLTPAERKAVLWARFGYCHEDIAAELGVTVEIVREHLRLGYLALEMSAPSNEE